MNKVIETFAKMLFQFTEPEVIEDEEPLSNCCTAPFTEPGWPDSDFCSQCHEHAGVDVDE